MGADRLRVLTAVALAGFLAAWLGYSRVWSRSGERPLAWRDHSASLRRVQLPRPTYEVFESRTELEAFLAARVEAAVAVPPIDFGRNLAVLLALGPRSSTGYAVEIVAVVEQRGRVLVVARERSPSRRDPVRPRVDYPLKLIELPDVGKPVALDWR